MSEDEDRLRDLLRAPLPDVAPVRFEPVAAPVRIHRAATISLVIVTVALITGTVALFRSTTDRAQSVAGSPPARSEHTQPQSAPLLAHTRDVPCDARQRFADAAQLRAFHPVVALRCDDVDRDRRAAAGGPFGALVRGLERRSDGVAPAHLVCARYFDVPPHVLLVDASGRYLRPRFPRDGCGHVHGTAAYLAYLGLHWHQLR